jgi:hypothetical protein
MKSIIAFPVETRGLHLSRLSSAALSDIRDIPTTSNAVEFYLPMLELAGLPLAPSLKQADKPHEGVCMTLVMLRFEDNRTKLSRCYFPGLFRRDLTYRFTSQVKLRIHHFPHSFGQLNKYYNAKHTDVNQRK